MSREFVILNGDKRMKNQVHIHVCARLFFVLFSLGRRRYQKYANALSTAEEVWNAVINENMVWIQLISYQAAVRANLSLISQGLLSASKTLHRLIWSADRSAAAGADRCSAATNQLRLNVTFTPVHNKSHIAQPSSSTISSSCHYSWSGCSQSAKFSSVVLRFLCAHSTILVFLFFFLIWRVLECI